MKTSAMPLVILTTLVLVTVSTFASFNIPFNWVFYTTVFGQGLLIFTIYKVLTDDYTTDKTFDDFYEDHPIGKEKF